MAKDDAEAKKDALMDELVQITKRMLDAQNQAGGLMKKLKKAKTEADLADLQKEIQRTSKLLDMMTNLFMKFNKSTDDIIRNIR